MMDKLENFIKEHREEFDVYEPDGKLWGKLKAAEKAKVKHFSWVWKVAMVLLVFCASFWAQIHMKNQNHNQVSSELQTNPEMAIPELMEADKYYSGLIQNKLTEVQAALVSYPEIKRDMKHELTELDSVFHSLRNDLKDNVSNPEIIEAMIQNYRFKLNLLEEIQAELQNRNNKNNSKNTQHGSGREI